MIINLFLNYLTVNLPTFIAICISSAFFAGCSFDIPSLHISIICSLLPFSSFLADLYVLINTLVQIFSFSPDNNLILSDPISYLQSLKFLKPFNVAVLWLSLSLTTTFCPLENLSH